LTQIEFVNDKTLAVGNNPGYLRHGVVNIKSIHPAFRHGAQCLFQGVILPAEQGWGGHDIPVQDYLSPTFITNMENQVIAGKVCSFASGTKNGANCLLHEVNSNKIGNIIKNLIELLNPYVISTFSILQKILIC
jgi:hypothetical protein